MLEPRGAVQLHIKKAGFQRTRKTSQSKRSPLSGLAATHRHTALCLLVAFGQHITDVDSVGLSRSRKTLTSWSASSFDVAEPLRS